MNAWLWQFGGGKPRLGGLSVTEAEERRIAVLQDGAKRGHATQTKRKHQPAARKARWQGAGNNPGWTLWDIPIIS